MGASDGIRTWAAETQRHREREKEEGTEQETQRHGGRKGEEDEKWLDGRKDGI